MEKCIQLHRIAIILFILCLIFITVCIKFKVNECVQYWFKGMFLFNNITNGHVTQLRKLLSLCFAIISE